LNDGRRPALSAQLANLLQKQGAEVHRLEQEFEVKEKEKPAPKEADAKASTKGDKSKDDVGAKKAEEAKSTKVPLGSYIIRMDQPYSRVVDMLLDTQYYSTNDPRPYDDTGWTLGALRNVKTVRVTDTAILKVPMTLIDMPARFNAGGVAAPHAVKGK